jgi:hypothetical protein
MLSTVIKTVIIFDNILITPDNSIHMASPFFSGRIPQDLYNRIEHHTKQSGESKTQILINALSAYLGYEIPVSSRSEIESIKTRLAALESAVKEIQTTEPKGDRYQMSISDVLDNTDNNLITESDNTDNSIEILPTSKVIELTGIPRTTLEDRRKKNQLPIEGNGYRVIGYEGKQKHNPHSNLWRVKIIS